MVCFDRSRPSLKMVSASLRALSNRSCIITAGRSVAALSTSDSTAQPRVSTGAPAR